MGGEAAAKESSSPRTARGAAPGAVPGTATNEASEGSRRWGAGGSGVRTERPWREGPRAQGSEGSGLRWAERRRSGSGAPDGARASRGGSQAPGIRRPRRPVRGPRSRRRPGPAPRGRGSRLGWRGRGGRSRGGASPWSPPPSARSLGGRRGVRATFSPVHPPAPAALLRGLVRPRPLTSPTSLLPSELHVWRRRRPGRRRGGGELSGRGCRRVPRSPVQPRRSQVGPRAAGAAGCARRGADNWARPLWLPLRQRDSGDLAPGPGARTQAGRGPSKRRLGGAVPAAVWSARSPAAREPRVRSPGLSEGCAIAELGRALRGCSGPGLRRTPSPPAAEIPVPATLGDLGRRTRPRAEDSSESKTMVS